MAVTVYQDFSVSLQDFVDVKNWAVLVAIFSVVVSAPTAIVAEPFVVSAHKGGVA